MSTYDSRDFVSFGVGSVVRAFDPHSFGVTRWATVEKVTARSVYVRFHRQPNIRVRITSADIVAVES